MRQEILLMPFLPWLALLASCSTPPKPPSVDETRKRPANTAMAVDLQICKNDLQNVHLQALAARRLAEAQGVMQANVATLQQALVTLQTQTKATEPLPNSIATVHFDHGRTDLTVPSSIATTLVKEAKSAPLIMLRGRTDGHNETPAESHIARARATAVSDYLVAAGVNPSRIRTTYQAVGDHAADNKTVCGRALNRRVEIEIYRARPIALNTGTATSSAAQ